MISNNPSPAHTEARWKSPRHPETGKQRDKNAERRQSKQTPPKIQYYTTLLHCLQSSSKRIRDPLFPPPSNPADFKRKNPDWINIAGATRKKEEEGTQCQKIKTRTSWTFKKESENDWLVGWHE